MRHAISDELISCYQYINIFRSHFASNSETKGAHHSSQEQLPACLGPVGGKTAKALSRGLVQPGNGNLWSPKHCWAYKTQIQ